MSRRSSWTHSRQFRTGRGRKSLATGESGLEPDCDGGRENDSDGRKEHWGSARTATLRIRFPVVADYTCAQAFSDPRTAAGQGSFPQRRPDRLPGGSSEVHSVCRALFGNSVQVRHTYPTVGLSKAGTAMVKTAFRGEGDALILTRLSVTSRSDASHPDLTRRCGVADARRRAPFACGTNTCGKRAPAEFAGTHAFQLRTAFKEIRAEIPVAPWGGKAVTRPAAIHAFGQTGVTVAAARGVLSEALRRRR